MNGEIADKDKILLSQDLKLILSGIQFPRISSLVGWHGIETQNGIGTNTTLVIHPPCWLSSSYQ